MSSRGKSVAVPVVLQELWAVLWKVQQCGSPVLASSCVLQGLSNICAVLVLEEASQMRALPHLTVGHVVPVKRFSQLFPNVLLWDGSLSLAMCFSFSSRGAKNEISSFFFPPPPAGVHPIYGKEVQLPV